MIVQKAREIRNARIEYVSLVDRAANKKRFLITKSADGTAGFLLSGKILKADRETHHITGIVYEPMTEDAHGDFMTEEEILKAAYWFAKNGDKVDRQHNFKTIPDAVVVETWVAKADTEIEGEPIRKGTWLITVETDDPVVWEAVQKEEITGFSMGGVGEYAKEDIPLNEKDTTTDKVGVLKKLAGLLGLDSDEEQVEKSGKKISGKNYESLKNICDNLNDFIAGFETPNETEDYSMTQSDVEKMVEAAVAKAFTKDETAEKPTETAPAESVTSADVEKMVDAAVEKAFNCAAAAPQETPLTAEAVQKMVDEAIAKALAPAEEPLTAEAVQGMVADAVTKAIEPVLKARGVSSNINGEKPVEKTDRHYLAGIL